MSLSTTITFPIIGESYVQPTGLFINNEFVKARSGKTFKVTSPIDESLLAELQQADAKDVEVAVDAAEAAFKKWSALTPDDRSEYVRKLAELIERDQDIITKIESLDNGKSLDSASWDLNMVVHYLKSCAGYSDFIDGRSIDTGDGYLNYTRREPLGVCGQIIPWNFPIMMWAWKVGPAIVSGNTVILKPASATPLSALYTAQLVKEAGIPPGVVNIIPGSGRSCGNAIVHHKRIMKVAFTGSTEVGRDVMVGAGESNIKKVTLELGGKSPNIVFADANLELAVQNVVTGVLFNGGEVCCAGTRVYVQDAIYDKFTAMLKKAFESIKVGNPFEKGVFQGAQATPDQFQTVLDYIQIGVKEGAKILTGGKRIGKRGYFVEPTIFLTDREDYRIVKEEIFGPVTTLSKFSTVDQVVEMANDSTFGLAAGVNSRDINKAINVAHRLKAGTVWVNTYNDLHHQVPFGGYKQSGIGREMGVEAFENYTQVKAIRVKLENPIA
ncbi:hypothetical protein PACTADRAFT_73742 [Pachysolen tannophilus NRRL Y-2460]|uniref:Aldehyde dehydrogenase 5, mitochondrial n=1 Tax=Pachysolen tannophilus NRRL Y-2460 TaxID=669874 RepID=A0A1E4U2A9_PACTA|nr:hypothetical protein PACTADRAFT_73742 [Pachysolen tannophilus NRRL Y-2460]